MISTEGLPFSEEKREEREEIEEWMGGGTGSGGEEGLGGEEGGETAVGI